MKEILDLGADVNSVGGYWDTALSAAARYAHLEIVEYLLRVPGIRINAVNGSAL